MFDRSTGPRAVTRLMIHDLEQLRAFVLERLSVIETVARQPGVSKIPEAELSAWEESLKKKTVELEASRHEFQVQADREKQEWIAAMSQLEEDRRLLAEAWERIDQERIEALSSHQESASVHALRPAPATPTPSGSPAVSAGVPIHSVGANSETFNPVAQAILEQFQTLCSDVRQNSRPRRASR